ELRREARLVRADQHEHDAEREERAETEREHARTVPSPFWIPKSWAITHAATHSRIEEESTDGIRPGLSLFRGSDGALVRDLVPDRARRVDRSDRIRAARPQRTDRRARDVRRIPDRPGTVHGLGGGRSRARAHGARA